MRLFKSFIYLIILVSSQHCIAQFSFDGYINNELQDAKVYLSVIEDFRKISGVYPEQIIARVLPDTTGYFQFTGNNLPDQNRMYRIHLDTCNESEQNLSHFSGHCTNSKEILFIANNTAHLSFPFSFDKEMFCKVESNYEKATYFLKIDSLKNEMRYAFGAYRSEANRKINSKKWFKTLQNYGEQLEEPLVELYIYSFLSNRSNNLYDYYLIDLKENTYYEELLTRLQQNYPDSFYTNQYENELKADQYLILNDKEQHIPWWLYLIISLLCLSIILNIYFFRKRSKEKKSHYQFEKLTKQEQKTLQLILQDKTNKEIADQLFVSVSTVKTHINNLYKKLNVSSREEVKKLKG